MAIQQRFVCDRDGATAIVAPDQFPPGWVGLVVIIQGEGQAEPIRARNHLCPTCKVALQNFMAGQAIPAL